MKRFIFLLAVISLTACTSIPTPPKALVADPDKTWEQRKLVLSEINDWHLDGRMAIINGDESWHLNMTWQRHADKYILDISGPFGAGRAQLTGTDEGVILIDSDENYFFANSPDRLLKEVTGIRMPVQSLLYWIRGLPDWNIEKDKQKIDDYGRLKQLHQDGWRVRFKRYVDSGKYELPQKVFIDGHELKVKIFIDEWDLKSKAFDIEKEDG